MFRNVFLSLVVVSSVSLLSSCDYLDDIEYVKSETLDFNQTTTIGEAFDNLDGCINKKWDEFETKNGKDIVEYTCDYENIDEFMDAVRKMAVTRGPHLNIVGAKFYVQWAINVDGLSFQTDYVGNDIEWADGRKAESEEDDYLAALQDVYDNLVLYDVNQFEGISQEEAEYVAESFSQSFMQLYETSDRG